MVSILFLCNHVYLCTGQRFVKLIRIKITLSQFNSFYTYTHKKTIQSSIDDKSYVFKCAKNIVTSVNIATRKIVNFVFFLKNGTD